MEGKTSACHNATVSPLKGGAEGELQCDVCGNKCEVVADSNTGGNTTGAAVGGATGSEEVKLTPGDTCKLPDDSDGIVSPEGICVPIATADQMPKVGDTCEIEGKPGIFEEREGGLVCVPSEQGGGQA